MTAHSEQIACKIKIRHNNKLTLLTVPAYVRENKISLLKFLNENGFFVAAPCGSRGICGGCKIFLLSGTLQKIFDGSLINAQAYIKSCVYTFSLDDCEIEISQKISKKSLSSRTGQIGALFSSIRNKIATKSLNSKYGIAIDIGTTNISIILFSLANGNIISEKHVINSQLIFASDVISRINLCINDKDMIAVLENCVIEKSIIPALDLILKESQAKPDEIERIAISGNTTMLHLLMGKDPSSMGTYPFTPLFIETIEMSFDQISKHKNCSLAIKALTTLLPGFCAFVGADILAGVYALDMIKNAENSILIDIGTNGEIALKYDGGLLVTSTAAGPVFEGFGLECGLTAIDGAISEFFFENGELRYKTINNTEPLGICGSGYISFIANARKASLIDLIGKFENAEKELKIEGTNIIITEADIARIIQAKAAISSGIKILLKNVSLKESDISKVYLAGSFGSNLKKEYAIDSGLLRNFEVFQIEFVGNSSLAGSYKYLMAKNQKEELVKIVSSAKTINLNEDPDFSDCYIDCLYLP